MTHGCDVFLDTNVLLYASNGRHDAPEKHETAVGMLTLDFGTSGQVLSEFYVNATRKGSHPLTADEASEWVRMLVQKPFQPIDDGVMQAGIRNSQRYQISYWDGAIIAAAQRLSAKTIYSEDLKDGQTYGEVRVVNPFVEH